MCRWTQYDLHNCIYRAEKDLHVLFMPTFHHVERLCLVLDEMFEVQLTEERAPVDVAFLDDSLGFSPPLTLKIDEESL